MSASDLPVVMRQELLALHAELLQAKPDGVEHDEAKCPLCALAVEAPTTNTPGGEVSDTTFTQEQVDAAIADAVTAATAPLQDRLADLEKAAQDTEVGKAVAAAVAPLNEQITEMQDKLDAAEVRATAAEEAKTNIEAFWSNAITEHEEAAAREGRKTERVEKAKAAGVLSDEYIAANADRFAEWSEEDFTARLDEWTQVAALAKGEAAEIPGATGFQAARETAAASNNTGSSLGLLREMRRGATDPRSL